MILISELTILSMETKETTAKKLMSQLGQSTFHKHSCDTCGKVFDGQYKLKRHMQSHTGLKEFECNTCGKGFAEQYKLKKHLLTHPESEQLLQFLCPSSVDTPPVVKSFTCDTCSKTFSEQYKLKRHLLTHVSSNEVKKTLALITGIKTYSCEACEKSFTELSKLKRHMQSAMHADFKFSTLENITNKENSSSHTNDVVNVEHDLDKSNEEEVVKDEDKSLTEQNSVGEGLVQSEEGQSLNKLPCTICGKEFDGLYKLNRHLMSHTGIKQFECETCGKSFSEAYKLKRHLFTHTGIKLFPCDLCEKAYTRSDHLNRHRIETHFSDFTCDVCSAEFDNKRSLSIHKRVHTPKELIYVNKEKKSPEKPTGYPCPLCKDMQPDLETHTAHMLTHGWKKVHTCSVCNKSFLRKCHLNVHEKIHSDNRPFECNVCSRSFYRSDHLKQHLKTHEFHVNFMQSSYSSLNYGGDNSYPEGIFIHL